MNKTDNSQERGSKSLFLVTFAQFSFAIIRIVIAAILFTSIVLILPADISQARVAEKVQPANPAALPSKFLRTIIVADYYPYTFVNEKGIPDGFSVDIAKACANVMDRKIEITVDTWGNATKALASGSIDLLPMMAASRERDKVFDFSAPHTIAYDAVFSRKGTQRISSLKDLAGKTVIVMSKDAAHDYLLSSGMAAKIKLVLVDSLPDALRTLAAGKADAALMPKLVGLITIKKLNLTNLDQSPVVIDAYNRPFSFAVKDGNQALLERLSQGLSIIKSTGQYQEIYNKWFGALDPPGLSWKIIIKQIAIIAAVFLLITLGLMLWNVSLRKRVALQTKHLTAELEERKRVEEELRFQSEIMTNIAEAIYLVRMDDGVIVYTNSVFERMFGYAQDEMLGKHVSIVNAPTEKKPDETAKEIMSEINDKGSWKGEVNNIKKDGTTFWSYTNVSVFDHSKYGRVLVAIHNDITTRKQEEQALRESEDKYRTLLDKMQEGIIIAQGGVFVLANHRLSEMLGVPSGNLKGKAFIDFVWPEDREMVMKNYRNRIAGEAIDDGYDFRIIGAQGKLTWVFLSAALIMWEGKPATLNLVTDITERKQAEEALAFLLQCGLPTTGEDFFESLARYLAKNTGMDYVCIDRLEGDGLTAQTVAVYNEGVFECNVSYALKDTPCGEVVGKGVCCYPRDVRHLFPRDQALEELKAESYFGITLVDSKGRQIGLIAVIGHHVLDDPKLVESLLKLVAPRAAGELERRQAEDELKKRESLLNKIFDVLPIGLWFTDKNGKLLRGNPAGVKIWGAEPTVPMEEYGVFKARRLPSREEIAPEDWALAHTIKEGVTVHDELLEIDAFDRQKRVILNYTAPVLDDKGNLLGAIVVNNDITDRKQAEEEKRDLEERLSRSEKMESLGTLAGGVAHDLNNVLGIVVGYAEMALDGVDKSSPLKHHLENVMGGGLKAAAIVDDLLTLARRGVSGSEVLNLNKIIVDFQKSPELEKLYTYHPSVKIKTEMDKELLNISGSSVHLSKSLYNLISNAAEAMPQGGSVSIKTTNQSLDKSIQGYENIREGDYVVLSVSDTGEGISETNLKHIFEPFYTKKKMGRSGTGLGLAVVWGTVKDHHGYINVESELGKGTTFTVYFPVTREDIAAKPETVAISEYMGKGESILIVDDVKEQRDLASGMLASLNYTVTTAESGEEAVEYLKEHQADIIILDMIMDPGLDGLDTYKSIIKIRPKQKAIIVSGYSESERVKAARSIGAGAYVRKPYIKEKLGLAVRKELDRTT